MARLVRYEGITSEALQREDEYNTHFPWQRSRRHLGDYVQDVALVISSGCGARVTGNVEASFHSSTSTNSPPYSLCAIRATRSHRLQLSLLPSTPIEELALESPRLRDRVTSHLAPLSLSLTIQRFSYSPSFILV